MPFSLSYRCLLGALLLVLTQNQAIASDDFNDRSLPAFGRSYFRVELVREAPLQTTQSILQSGDASILFGYRYNMANTWLMGVSTVFRNFKRTDQGPPVSFWAVSHESLYIMRVYHPVYFMIGPVFSYLLASRKPRFPVEEYREYEPEIAVGLAANIAYIINDRWFIGAKLERWRGTRTDKFHALETGLSVNINLE